MPTTAGLEHPRTIGWLGTTALGMGGSNQSLFLISALLASQGSAAVPLLILGLLLSWAALPGWTELIMMWPNRVGGIAATCAEAFRPYSPVLANLTGTCYWWGWVPTCGLTALLSASALHHWYLHSVPIKLLAVAIVVIFTLLNLAGMARVTRVAVWIACGSAALAFASGIIPVLTGHVDWQQASSFHLDTPFRGVFGAITSAMAGLYLIGFAAPAFEAAACHVGETVDPERNVPRAMYASAGMATLYFLVLPVVWLGVLGPKELTGDLARVLGPTFAPILGSGAKAAAIWFMVLNMFHGTLTPLTGAARTLSQLSEDGLLPRSLARRSRTDAPWVASLLTAGMATLFLIGGDPVWVIAAANFTYLIGIALPSVAVWLLRRNEPERHRPYRARRGTIGLGLLAAGVWLLSTVLGFEQFGLPTVLFGLGLAYSGSAAYAWRMWRDKRGQPRTVRRSLHLKLTGAMIAVLVLDGAGYLIAVGSVPAGDASMVTVLQDIFVAVALVTITVGLVLPGMIAHAATQVANAADRLATGTLADLTRAMKALSDGDLEAARARVENHHVDVHSSDEVGAMATSFNTILDEAARAAASLDGAREALRSHRDHLEQAVSERTAQAAQQAAVAGLGRKALERLQLSELITDALGVVGTALEVELTSVLELTPDAQAVRLIYGRGWPPFLVGATTVARGPQSPSFRALASGKPVVINDLADPSDLDIPAVWHDRGAVAGVWVPITVRHQPYGVLTVHANRPRRFSQDDVHFLESVANVIGSAVERVRSDEQLAYQALHDPLTDLPNRILFADRLDHALARLERKPSTLAVLFVDVDRFKLINDSLGHAKGDEVLVAVAGRIREALRPADTVARFGGDEFVVLCEDLADEVEAISVADRLQQFTSRPITVNGSEYVVSVSTGIALAASPDVSAEELLRDADAAMYHAKEDGRGRAKVFAEALRAKVLQRLDTEVDLRRAIAAGELRVHYQPVVDIATGLVTEIEALVRWAHPERGLVSPAEFIPVAEETGLIFPLGEWVLEEACSQTAAWQRNFPHLRGLGVCVNLSGRQLAHRDIGGVVAAVLAKTELDPTCLTLEITESVLMKDAEDSIDAVHSLAALGVRLSIDDFGTGYSSLAYLKRFSAQVLKIDKSFVDGLGVDPQDTAIVGATIALADALGMETVAEGVEEAGQLAHLERLGCDRAQGYFFSRPLADTEMATLLARLPRPAAVTARA